MDKDAQDSGQFTFFFLIAAVLITLLSPFFSFIQMCLQNQFPKNIE